MGTRSMTYVIDEYDNKTPITSLYRQYDGYPTGMGQDLYNFLANRQTVNGFGEKSVLVSNGMDDLAAQLVCYLKNDKYATTGNVYLYSLRKLPTVKQTFEQYRDKYLLKHAKDCGCEYVYIIRKNEAGLELQVHSLWADKEEDKCFIGTPQEVAEKFELKTDEALTSEDKQFYSLEVTA